MPPINRTIKGVRGFERVTCLKLGYRQVLTIRMDTIATITSHATENANERTGAVSIYTAAATKPAPAGMGTPTKCL